MKKIISRVVAVVFLGSCVTGCEGYMAAKEAVKTVSTVTTALSNKIPITSGNMRAEGVLDNPAYDGECLYVTGIKFHVQLQGAKVGGSLYGEGSGGDNSFSPEFAEILERAKKGEPGALDRLLSILEAKIKEKTPTTQPGASP